MKIIILKQKTIVKLYEAKHANFWIILLKTRLFRKKIERSGTYCVHGAKLNDGTILCAKKGIQGDDQGCVRFKYDPCKRIPLKGKAPDFGKYTEDDFKL